MFLRPFLLMISLSIMTTLSASTSTATAKLAALEATSGGRLGIAAMQIDTPLRVSYRGEERFPVGCTAKIMGVAAILKKSMSDQQFLQETLYYKKSDLTNWTPITEKHLAEGMTIEKLAQAAISYSDNTAMNLLAQQIGGPAGITAYARSIGDKTFRLDHGWPEEALANPAAQEDSSSPEAMQHSLHKIIFGGVLGKPQRQLLVHWMQNNTTGDKRIRAGVPKNWVVGDKTGTGFHYGITNDIAIIWPPHCKPIILAAYYSNKSKTAPKRDDLIASATRIVLDYFSSEDPCLQKQKKVNR